MFFSEKGSDHTGAPRVQDDRAKRICSRCSVRRECLTETIACESPQQTVARNASVSEGSWLRARPERQLPTGVFAGVTADERWAPEVIHGNDCPGGRCHGCRPIDGRIELLEEVLRSQARLFLLPSETVTPLS